MFKNKKAQLDSSVLIIIILGLVVIASGIFLLTKILLPFYSIDKTTSKNLIGATVYPLSGLPGTLFNIRASGEGNFSRVTAMINSRIIALYDDGKHGDEKAADNIYGNSFDSTNLSVGKFSGEISAYKDNVEYKGYFNLNIFDNFCTSLTDNGDSDKKIDLVFIPVGYTSTSDFKADILKYADFQGTNQGIFSYTPFKENEAKFNVHYLNELYSLEDLGCKIGCKGVDSLVCCDDKKVFASANLCPADQVILLINNDSFCASSSSYAKICTKGEYNSPMALVHELGHSFGGLGDEYDYSEYSNFEKITDYNFPNCVSDCSVWPSGIEAGCFGGCGYSQFYRSAEKDSIMYGYSDVFNPLCIHYLNNNLDHYDLTITNDLPAPGALKYIVELNYSYGKFIPQRTYVVPGKSPDRNNINSSYNVLLRDFSGKVIYSSYFNVGEIIQPFFSPIAISKPTPFIEHDLSYSLVMPYSPSGRNIEIYQKSVLLTSLDVAYLSNGCGNGICEVTEDYASCPKDCSVNQDHICSPAKDNVCDKNCPFFEDFDCYKPLIVVFFISLLIVVALIIYLFKKRKIIASV